MCGLVFSLESNLSSHRTVGTDRSEQHPPLSNHCFDTPLITVSDPVKYTMSSPWEVRLSTSHNLSQDEVQKLPGAAKYLGGGGSRPAPPEHEGKVRASHLLVKHSGSRRPSSWKEQNITRSKAEAIAILNGYADEIQGNPETFARLAQKHSDCSSHEKGGDLGLFGRGQMQKPFEDATYALEPGAISGIIDTDSGVHLIMRTA
ncbi:hypothetical protein FRB95_007456 [Tulasnella sp. JGI-2019a]|nr:hypothetical protein FRB93_007352 [Tulasnella sp. JGI-2019a]KAG9027685.1 hypothetical protein FRB95_007456 [Tulasnella sp. JGI-2019a]